MLTKSIKFRERKLIVYIIGCVFTAIAVVFLLYYGSSVTPLEDPQATIASLTRAFAADSELEPQSAVFVSWPELKAFPGESSYPQYTPLLDVIKSWNPDVAEPPERFVETLQHFNYSDPYERKLAEEYRNAEVPFKLYDVPNIDQVRLKWNKQYLAGAMRYETPHVEKSTNNHFMYWTKKRKSGRDYKPPTDLIKMTFAEWSEEAERADRLKLNNESVHYYYMLGSRPGDRSKSFIAKDLPIFSTRDPNFFIPNPRANKGTQCRFGMRGVIAEAHYDSGRNMVAMIRGRKRYILTPPKTCKYLGIISDMKHPSFRHSIIDWSDIQQATAHRFDQVDSIDTIVRTGEVLYIPSFWFHYIISLEYSIQCNSRSGFPDDMKGAEYIERSDCIDSVLGDTQARRRKRKNESDKMSLKQER